ncbi:transcriptional regulator, HxlR family [Halogranum amylolyticum]|uniref:Transcriptional regulator, HxlR family n=1 Tax=Halogranum amylolyticum TaxID=660520 RepID=A0A1H8WLH9_9EURY|nr:helix-turn-helix domain-containing protein [Halogranum amylolyticum]SEP28482.1 transcriptional regulator, HxlR family [Halogranum amylolyticum]
MNRSEPENCVASWCADDDWCTVTCTAHLIGKKWHPVIVHRLLEHGPLGFNALKEKIGKVSSTVLSNSLDDLEENGLVNRDIVNEKPFRVSYSLTEQGEQLAPVIEAMAVWGESYLESAACGSSSGNSDGSA